MEGENSKRTERKGSSRVLRKPLLWIIVALVVAALGYDFLLPDLTTDGLYEQIGNEMRGLYTVPQDEKAVEKVFQLCNKIVGKSIDETEKAKAYRLLAGFDPETGALLDRPRMDMLLKAADCGDSEACCEVGRAYMYGRDGLARDPEKAVAYLQKSDDKPAKAELGAYYMRQQNFDEAYEVLKGYENDAQFGLGGNLEHTVLGLLHYYGLGGAARDMGKARTFFGIDSAPMMDGRTDFDPERSDYDDLESKKCICCGNLQLSPANLGYLSMTEKIDGAGFVPYIYSARNFYARAVRLGVTTDLTRLLAVLDSFLDMYEEYMRDGVKTTNLLNGLWNNRFLRRTGKTLGAAASSYWGELKNGNPDGWGVGCTFHSFRNGEIGSVTIGRWKHVYAGSGFGWTEKVVGPFVRSEISKDGNILTITEGE